MNYGVRRFHHCGRRQKEPAAALLLSIAFFLIGFSISFGNEVSAPRLKHAEASQEDLARAVLRTIAEENLEAMKDLSLSKEEFRKFVWPELPVSNPKTNLSVDFVWNDVFYRSMMSMQRIFNKLKGRDLKLVRVECHGEVAEYKSHRAYPDMEVIIREEDGKEVSFPLFGTLIEMDGLWKVYSYAPYH
jgi:hypothetical protein